MFSSILIVCTGNICRSAMAEALLIARLRERGLKTRVESAGLGALVGHRADEMAAQVLKDRHGLDVSEHRGRQLTAQLTNAFELILVMEMDQQKAIERKHPTARGRVHRMGRVGGFDIPDPYRQGREAFEHSLDLIEQSLDEMGHLLWGRAS